MALVVFLRGLNVGGHRRFRPSILAEELSAYDVVNVGAAGTLVVFQPGSSRQFLAELRRRLPPDTDVAVCRGSDLINLEKENPFDLEPLSADLVHFVSVLSKPARGTLALPVSIPPSGTWFVRIVGSRNGLVYGVYRRHMKTIGYLGQIDTLFGVPATTRSWNTVQSVLRILKTHE